MLKLLLFAYRYSEDNDFSATYTVLDEISGKLTWLIIIGIVLIVMEASNGGLLKRIAKVVARPKVLKAIKAEKEREKRRKREARLVKEEIERREEAERKVEQTLAEEAKREQERRDSEEERKRQEEARRVEEEKKAALRAFEEKERAKKQAKKDYVDKLYATEADGVKFSPTIFTEAAKLAQTYVGVDAEPVLTAKDEIELLRAWKKFWPDACAAYNNNPANAKAIKQIMADAKKMYKALPPLPKFED